LFVNQILLNDFSKIIYKHTTDNRIKIKDEFLDKLDSQPSPSVFHIKYEMPNQKQKYIIIKKTDSLKRAIYNLF